MKQSGWLIGAMALGVLVGCGTNGNSALVSPVQPTETVAPESWAPENLARESVTASDTPTWAATPQPKLTKKAIAKPTVQPKSTKAAAPVSDCHPSYVGACLREGIGDYDCKGGTGNGPNYIEGPIQVVGYDEFDLDRDGDGWGCDNG